jgi:hypothetical protein
MNVLPSELDSYSVPEKVMLPNLQRRAAQTKEQNRLQIRASHETRRIDFSFTS